GGKGEQKQKGGDAVAGVVEAVGQDARRPARDGGTELDRRRDPEGNRADDHRPHGVAAVVETAVGMAAAHRVIVRDLASAAAAHIALPAGLRAILDAGLTTSRRSGDEPGVWKTQTRSPSPARCARPPGA